MELKYKTLADTLAVWNNIPSYLQIEDSDMENDRDVFYENVYRENYILSRMREAKGARKLFAPYFHNTDDPSWEDFLEKNAEEINSMGISRSDYNREWNIFSKSPNDYGQKFLNRAKPNTNTNDEDDEGEDDDSSPELSLDDPNVNPILKSLYKASNAAKNATMSVEDSVKRKYKVMYDTVRNVANATSLNCHAAIFGEAGVGKTHTCKEAIFDGLKQWKPNERHKEKPEYVYVSGSVGNSMTDLVTFFYKNRFQKIIVLDDADGFLLSTDQSIQNFLKRILDPDFPTVTVPSIIRQRANKNIEEESGVSMPKRESRKISLNFSHLHEGKCSVSVDDSEEIPFFPSKRDIHSLKKVFKLNEVSSDVLSRAAKALEHRDEPEVDFIDTPSFDFNSNVVVISNLDIDEINEAVISRCDQYELHLTIEEFICRAEMILDHLSMGKFSSTPPEVIQWAKREAFAIFKIMILEGRKYKGMNFTINVHLDFRFLTKVTNRMIIRLNDFCLEHGLDPSDKSIRPQIEAGVMDDFIGDLLTLLSSGGKRKKK